MQQTVDGEPLEIYPFLGSSRLEEPINRYPVSLVFHGHAHRGQLEGARDRPVDVGGMPGGKQRVSEAVAGHATAHLGAFRRFTIDRRVADEHRAVVRCARPRHQAHEAGRIGFPRVDAVASNHIIKQRA